MAISPYTPDNEKQKFVESADVPGQVAVAVANADGTSISGGGGGGGATTIDDGDDATQGAIADAAATAGGTGTVSAKLRKISADIAAVLTAVQGATPAGTNNIGDVDIASALPAGNNNIGDVDVASLPATPAGTNLIGKVSAGDDTSTMYNGTTALTPKFAIIDAATSGDNTLVTAVASKKIRVHSLYIVASAAVTVRFESGASGTALSGQMQLAANGGFTLPYNPAGWFETASNTLLNLELSGAISVDGGLQYTEV